MNTSLYLSLDEYSSFYVKNIILTYNICYADSILNDINLINNFNNLVINNPKNKMKKNKELLKISDKKLPLTADITKWGEIKIIKGAGRPDPYKFNLKETRVLISSKDINTPDGFNYIVSIRGLKFKDKKIVILLKKESV